MPRIAPLDPQRASGETTDIFREINAAFGMVPNLFRTSAHYPPLGVMELFVGFNKFLDSLHVDIDFPRWGA